ncbi:IST1-like protein [Nymphaea thermarum]|nr:IST1-like protein [Nymphaea thermarum]
MSMLDALFNKGFRGAKCKTLLKLTIPRIKLLRNRKEAQMKQMRKEIAKLLETGQEATARIRVEHIIREQKTLDAYEIIELFCELITVRLPIIETQRECPLDLKEAISSLCFAAPRCSDLPELLQAQMLFAAKYGREFVIAATELMPDCGVNRQIIELLSVRAPPVEEKLRVLKAIAEEHELDWDPTDSEAELLKPHEDLLVRQTLFNSEWPYGLNGPSQFIDGSKVPLPEAKHDESFYSGSIKDSHEKLDPETGFDILDLPEAPRGSIHPNYEKRAFPDVPPPSAPSHDSIINSAAKGDVVSHETLQHPSKEVSNAPTHRPSPDTFVGNQDKTNLHTGSDATIVEPPSYAPVDSSVSGISKTSINDDDDANFRTLNVAPDSKVGSREEVHLRTNGVMLDSHSSMAPNISSDTEEKKSQCPDEKDSVPVSYVATGTSVSQEEKKQFLPFNPPVTSSGSSQDQRMSSISRTKTAIPADLQDVLAAAQQAAETAESAAAAARSAANLAQIKISELYNKRGSDLADSGRKDTAEDRELNSTLFDESEQKISSGTGPSYHSGLQTEIHPQGSEEVLHPSFDTPRIERESSNLDDQDVRYERSTSMDDDPFSYPNLFSTQSSFGGHGVYSPTHKHAHDP